MRIVRHRSALKGIPVSPGVVIGRVYLIDRSKVRPPERLIDPGDVEREIARFQEALSRCREELRGVKGHYERNNIGDYGYLVDVHLLMLDDQMLHRETERLIRENLHSADWALWQTIQKIKEIFAGLEDEYFRDRQNDIDHLGERILRNMEGLRLKQISDVKEDVIIVAHDLSPMDTAQMDVRLIKGFVTDLGGRTSHTAILARALGIPAVVGLERITGTANGGDVIALDGLTGRVVLNPPEEELAYFKERRDKYRVYLEELGSFASLPAVTRDEAKVSVRANIELLEELKNLERYGAEGVGLYRTEFLYLNRDRLPTEEEHFETYAKVAEAVKPHSLTIRTLDLGGDKVAHGVPMPEESNPALGLRSIRLCLNRRDIFKTQLRAVLRASVAGNVRMMFPMVSGVGEVLDALAVVGEVKKEMRSENLPFDDAMKIGVMIEVPSAAVVADAIAKHVDFMSIGTNDLIQYSLAIDRVNEHVAYLYEPLHPAVLRLIAMTAEAGKKAGIPVAVCGEMAGDELYTLLLLGLGVGELSMHAASIPRVKRIISHATLDDARLLARNALTLSTAAEVYAAIEDQARSLYPGLLDPLGSDDSAFLPH